MSVKLDDAGLQHRLRGSFDGPFLGTPALIGPWGCPAALPRCQGLTDSSNEACHRQARDRSRAGTELQSVYVTSKEFWFLSSSEGVKRRPLWETGSPGLPLNISPFTACQFSVLEMHRSVGVGRGGCGDFFIIKKRQKGEEAHCPMRLGLDAAIWMQTLSFAVIVIVPVYSYSCFQSKIWVFLEKEKNMSGIFGFVHILVRMDREVETLSIYLSLSHTYTSLLPVMEGCWRAVEPQKTHPHFVLLFTISGFRTL